MHWRLFDNATEDLQLNDIKATTIIYPLLHLLATLLLPRLALGLVLAVRFYEEAINKSIMEQLYLLVEPNPTHRPICHNSKQDSKSELIESIELEKLNLLDTLV